MNKSQKKKVRQTADGELTPEEIQHLRRCGFTITKSSSKRPTKRPLRRFAAWWETTPVEKFLEDIVFLLKNAALFDIINLVAGVTIIISLITWLATERQRRNAEVYQVWQVITAAYGQSGSGGRKEALEFLNSTPRRFPLFWLKWEKESLAGLAAPNAYLRRIQIPQASLLRANLQGADLSGANLQLANLKQVNLPLADLSGANLQKSSVSEANLQKAIYTNQNTPQNVCERLELKHPCPTIFPNNFNLESHDILPITNLNELENILEYRIQFRNHLRETNNIPTRTPPPYLLQIGKG